jgi:putative FmdB family regulatory protein
MPLYEYICEKCEEPFEELRSAGERKPPRCHRCGCMDVTRVLSPVSLSTGAGRPAAGLGGMGGCGGSGFS